MSPFPDYNPNYEERRGRYAPADGQNRLHDNGQAAGSRQNAAMPTERAAQDPIQDDPDDQGYNDEA